MRKWWYIFDVHCMIDDNYLVLCMYVCVIDNHAHADFHDDMTPEGRMCMGPVKEVFDKKFTPNGYFHCHHEEPSSRKCANNHMYPPPPEQQ